MPFFSLVILFKAEVYVLFIFSAICLSINQIDMAYIFIYQCKVFQSVIVVHLETLSMHSVYMCKSTSELFLQLQRTLCLAGCFMEGCSLYLSHVSLFCFLTLWVNAVHGLFALSVRRRPAVHLGSFENQSCLYSIFFCNDLHMIDRLLLFCGLFEPIQ